MSRISHLLHAARSAEGHSFLLRLFREFGLDAIIAMCVIFAMAFIPPSYIMILVRERATGAKHLQLVSGVHPALYWLSNFTWNMVCRTTGFKTTPRF